MLAFIPRSPLLPTLLVACAALLLGGCDYDVPLSTTPDRGVERNLLGNWLSPHGWMMVRRFDADHYVVVHNGSTYRGWHTSVEGAAYVTLQSIDREPSKYAYVTYRVSEDGRRLEVRFVRDGVVPKTIMDSTAMRRAIAKHSGDSALLSDPEPFTRMP
jgi:hypothetical protein